jgi:inner membrane transporter RhtA
VGKPSLVDTASVALGPVMTERGLIEEQQYDSGLAQQGHGVWLPVLLVGISCLAIQGCAAVATPLFTEMNPAAVAAWRQLIGAICLVVLLRPRLRGRDLGRGVLIVLLGIAMAAMNTSYYAAVQRLPLGVAAALIYLGAFAVAVTSIRRIALLIWPVLALIGVLVIARPDQASPASLVGVCLGVIAGLSLAAYTMSAYRLGRRAALADLALAVCVSALALTPVSMTHRPASPSVVITLVLLGVLGVALPLLCDYWALRLGGPSLVATLFALDPALGALIGLMFLGQTLAVSAVAGLGAICLAGIGLTRAQQPRSSPRSAPGP